MEPTTTTTENTTPEQSGIFIEEVPHKLIDIEIDAEGGAIAPIGKSKGFICGFISKGSAFNIVGESGTPNVYTDRIEAAAIATFWLYVHESQSAEETAPAKRPMRPTDAPKKRPSRNTPKKG